LSRRIVFISSNFTWGGSEILWSEAAAELASRGHDVRAYKNRFPPREGNVPRLKALGVRCIELARFPLLPRRLYSLLLGFTPSISIVFQSVKLHLSLRLRRRPDLIVLSQGGNHDGWLLGAVCRRHGIPLAIICQKASDLYWPQDRFLNQIRAMYRAARHVFFVSQHNATLTEEQIGERVASASVVRNPFLVPWEARSDWPGGEALRLACVGRLYPLEKGQDILLRVLAMPKWKARPLSVTFYGAGEQRRALEAMAVHLGLTSVAFEGYADDVAGIWSRHHGLVLASRAEGLPLALVETMLSARVAIVTDVAGNAEVVEDGVTGFLAAAPTEAALDEAMERAWGRRNEWRAIGEAAGASIRRLVPPNPAASASRASASSPATAPAAERLGIAAE
jgi:glycosyltransferase involved in cell wall biosynthesis